MKAREERKRRLPDETLASIAQRLGARQGSRGLIYRYHAARLAVKTLREGNDNG